MKTSIFRLLFSRFFFLFLFLFFAPLVHTIRCANNFKTTTFVFWLETMKMDSIKRFIDIPFVLCDPTNNLQEPSK